MRVPSDNLAALKEAREKIEQAIAKQDEIKQEIKEQEKAKEDAKKPEPKSDKLVLPGTDPLPKPGDPRADEQKAIQDAVKAEKNAKIADKQAKNAFETQDTANQLKPIAPEAAKSA